MPRRSFSVLVWLALVAPVYAQAPLHVAAAADLQPLLPSILREFTQETGIHADGTYKDSAMLTTQILNGAPFDLFLAADLGYPQRLIAAGAASPAKPIPYAQGTLVLWARKDSRLPRPSLALLRNPNLKRLAIADPRRAPYGQAAVAALKSLHLYAALKPRLLLAENIAQAAQFAGSANADAGLISLTSALTPQLESSGTYFVIPRGLYPPIVQGMVIVNSTHQRADTQKLADFLLSAPVQAQLAKGGLAPVH